MVNITDQVSFGTMRSIISSHTLKEGAHETYQTDNK